MSCSSHAHSTIAMVGAGGDNFMAAADEMASGPSHGEQTNNPPPLRRNKSSLRLLTELTRERIALRCVFHPYHKLSSGLLFPR